MHLEMITVTLTPAINAILWMDTLSSEQKNYVTKERTQVSSGSLNVSRILQALGCESLAMGIYGEENGTQFIKLLEEQSPLYEFYPCKGAVAQHITMVLPKNTVIQTVRNGFDAGFADLNALQLRIREKAQQQKNSILVFTEEQMQMLSGMERVRFIQNCCAEDTRLVLRLNGVSLSDLQDVKPYLTVIALAELKAIAKVNFRNETTMLRCMQSMTDRSEHIVVDLGARGFLYAGKDICYRIVLPHNKLSHPERADHFIGGFLAGMQKNLSLYDTLVLAGGAAAWLTLCESDAFDEAAVERGKQKIVIEKMNGITTPKEI